MEALLIGGSRHGVIISLSYERQYAIVMPVVTSEDMTLVSSDPPISKEFKTESYSLKTIMVDSLYYRVGYCQPSNDQVAHSVSLIRSGELKSISVGV